MNDDESHEIQRIPTPPPPRSISPISLTPDAVPASFSPVQTLAMGYLLAGKSKTDAARAAGVDRTTVHHWLRRDPEFRAYFNSARKELLHRLTQRQLLLAGLAIRTQEKLLRSRKTPPAIKARVAADVLARMPTEVSGPDTAEAAMITIAGEYQQANGDRMKAGMFLREDDPEQRLILAKLNPDKLRGFWYRLERGLEKADPELTAILTAHFGRSDQ